MVAGIAVTLAVLWPLSVARADVSVVDDRGATVALSSPAHRIVALSPHLVENLFAIGAGPRIVATVTHSDYPAAAAGIEVIGSFDGFDIERVLEISPDLVVGWLSGNRLTDLEQLERLGIPVFLSEPRSPGDVARELISLGRLTGLDAAAARTASAFTEAIARTRSSFSTRSTVRVFYQVWNEPVITLGGQHMLSALISDCGGVNVFQAVAELAPTVSVESVLERDPDVIIASGESESRPPWLDAWKRFEFLRPVRRHALFHIDPNLVQRHTTRLADGFARLCELIDAVRPSVPRD